MGYTHQQKRENTVEG